MIVLQKALIIFTATPQGDAMRSAVLIVLVGGLNGPTGVGHATLLKLLGDSITYSEYDSCAMRGLCNGRSIGHVID